MLQEARARNTWRPRGDYVLQMDGDKRTCILPKDELEVPPCQIPLCCLIAPGDVRKIVLEGVTLEV